MTPRGKKQLHDPMALTQRESVFVLKMLTLNHITDAYLAAGYKCTRRAAGANGARLIASDRVKRALEAARAKHTAKLEVDADEAFRRLAVIAGFDIGDLLDDLGKMLPLKALPADVRRCIKSIDKDGNVRAHDAMRALELIAETGGKIRRKVDLTLGFDHVGFLEQLGPTTKGKV